MTTYEMAVAELKTAETVKDWNTIRERWADKLNPQELALIDSGGLIVQTLGRDVAVPEYMN